MSTLAIALLSSIVARDIEWQTSLEACLARAPAESKVVFLAVNMDGEPANERMAEGVYRDKTIVRLSERTLNAVASASPHPDWERPCPRFRGIACADHRLVDMQARERILEADGAGRVVAPQHVFLAPDGSVIFSVPYEITALELEWCLAKAILTVDPDAGLEPFCTPGSRSLPSAARSASSEAATPSCSSATAASERTAAFELPS